MKYIALRAKFNQDLEDLYDFQESSALFYIALEKAEGTGRMQFIEKQQSEVAAATEFKLLELLNELKSGKPIQYAIGEAWFYGLKFLVTPDVLIPRDETEELVDLIIKDIKSANPAPKMLLDIGTGSGCIAIAVKKKIPMLQVSAMDVSSGALAVAKENAITNEVIIEFIEADVLTYKTELKFEVIVSNPPYIKEDEKSAMHNNVLQFEPGTALFVSNEDPLIFYRAIADLAKQSLNPLGTVYFEINEYLGKEMVVLMKEKGFKNVRLLKDLQQKDRILTCNR
jgi:release factor glutamine methyltransferase